MITVLMDTGRTRHKPNVQNVTMHVKHALKMATMDVIPARKVIIFSLTMPHAVMTVNAVHAYSMIDLFITITKIQCKTHVNRVIVTERSEVELQRMNDMSVLLDSFYNLILTPLLVSLVVLMPIGITIIPMAIG